MASSVALPCVKQTCEDALRCSIERMRIALNYLIFSLLHLVTVVSLVAILSLQAVAQQSANAKDLTMWRMIWVDDFGVAELPHEDIAPYLDDFIRSVKITTSRIDGQLVNTRASAGCNGMGRSTSRRIVTPAKTIESYRDGKLHYETTPATYETITGWSTTQKGCSLLREIGGKKYNLNWFSPMEDFLLSHAPNVSLIRKDNHLEWADTSGTIIARFVKLPDIVLQYQGWFFDPDRHSDDPVMSKYFGPAKVYLNFPSLSYHRACERVSTPIELSETRLHITGKIYSSSCDGISYLINGQRHPYEPQKHAPHNLLNQVLPKVTHYEFSDNGETKRLTLLGEDNNKLLHLIASDEGPSRQQATISHRLEALASHEWILDRTESLHRRDLKAISPIRIFRHHGYSTEGPKNYASIISAQDCAINNLHLNGYNQHMNIHHVSRYLDNFQACDEDLVSEIRAEWGKTRNMLYDENYLIFYDTEWKEVMRARRGEPLGNSAD